MKHKFTIKTLSLLLCLLLAVVSHISFFAHASSDLNSQYNSSRGEAVDIPAEDESIDGIDGEGEEKDSTEEEGETPDEDEEESGAGISPDPDEELGDEEDGEDGDSPAPDENETDAAEDGTETDASASESTEFGARIIDGSTVEVSTYDQLIEALGNINYTDIYFANDIIATAPANMEQRAIINPAKTQQRIYGRAYGGSDIFTFTQYEANYINYTIRVLNDSRTTHVTVADMNIVGRNSFGIVQVENTMAGVTIRLENITYTGPQPVENRYGTVQFANADIQLAYGTGNSTGNAADAFNIEFEGHNSIHTRHSVTTYNVFAMSRINSTGGKFHVLPNASVNITSPSTLFHTDGAADLSPALLFGEGSSFLAECGQGFTQHYVNEIVIAPNASVRLAQSASTADGYAVRIRNRLLVEEGAVFEVLRPKGGTAAIQLFNSGTITFNNPERVVIYANSKLLVGCVGGSSININTDSINLWSAAPGGSSAGEPAYIWNKWGKQALSVNVYWSGTNSMGSVYSNLDMEMDPVKSDITTKTFAVRESQLMVLGRIGAAVEEVAPGDTKVTGFTEPGALLTGTYTTLAGSDGVISSGFADAKGKYELSLNDGTPLPGSRVYITACKDGLRVRQYPYEIEPEPVLEFLSVPDIRFETIKIPFSSTYIKRTDPDWAITVRDTRKGGLGFEIQASMNAPMTAVLEGETYTIPDGLVYVNERGGRTPLSDSPLTVYSGSSGLIGDHTVQWDDDRGILMWAGPGSNLRANVEYSTIVEWTLVSAP